MKTHVLVYCLVGGLPVTIAALGAGHFGWWWLSGILFAGSFVPAALFGPRNVVGQFAVIAPVLLIVTVLCTYCAWAAPLAVPNALMGTRHIHTVEIFTQNFSLGVTAALLLRPRSVPLAASQPAAAAGPTP